MSAPLVATKLHVPRRRAQIVLRPRLTERLSAGGDARLVLVAAPAGFGKTTVLTEWLTAADPSRPIAWVSLDARDNVPAVFCRYLLTAVEAAVPGAGTAALALLDSTGSSMEAALATLINDLDALSSDVVIVLDDFHVLGDSTVTGGVAFLAENLPPAVRLVIASRSDPPLPLARLRARGELTEVRAADLRFTADEAAAYLTDVMGLTVRDQDIVALGTRTEGWIAALQLAALSMQGRDDVAAFVAGFSGDDRFVVDYLVEEVLQLQPDDVRTFLLRTSILPRITGDLADAVTGGTRGAAALVSLDRANLFLVPLDDHRHWYRYHHLFAEMLRARLLAERAGEVQELHRRASDWHEREGQLDEAIEHAIAGGAFDRAADLLEAAMPSLRATRQEETLVGWLERLPADTLRSRPLLSAHFAGALLSVGRLDRVEELLDDAQASADAGTEVTALRNEVTRYRAATALAMGDLDRAEEAAELAAELSADDDAIGQGAAAGLLGLVRWSRGDLPAAATSWAEAVGHIARAGHLADAIGGSIAVADIQLARGRLSEAERTYRAALEDALSRTPPTRGAADMHVGLAGVLRERNELDGARAHLTAAAELGEYAGLPQNRHRLRVARARLLEAEGDPAAAIALFDEAERLYTPDLFPDVRPIAAQRVRAQLAADRVPEALAWARARGVGADDEPAYLIEFEHRTLARVLLNDSDNPRAVRDAIRLLERLLAAAGRADRSGDALETMVILSLALQAAGRSKDALGVLARAVSAAEPEGYLRVFADEGAPMARLLAALAATTGGAPYLRRLIDVTQPATQAATQAAGQRPTSPPPAPSPSSSPSLPSPPQGPLPPLSARELEVLRLLATDLSGAEIARHLVVSLNTVRTHTKSVYTKLGVTSRRAAVRRASELGLLTSR
jgi:LuxR family maltose regulon positive regulatory protein